MIYYRVKVNGANRKVYTSSLNRSVEKYGYFTYLEFMELLTKSEYVKVILSERAYTNMFEKIELSKNKIEKKNGKRFAI